MPLRRYVDRHPLVSLLLFWLVVPLAIFAVAVTSQVQNRHQLNRTKRLATQGAQALTAICALRADRIKSVQRSEMFLLTHPNGIPGLGAASIRASIYQQQQTIKALDVVNCK